MDKISLEDEKVRDFEFSDAGVEWYGEMEDKPEIEQRLHALQAIYYGKKRTQPQRDRAFSEMFELIQSYAKSLFLKRAKGGKFIDPDVVEDGATSAAIAFMNQYIVRPGFHIGASFGAMLDFKVREAWSKSKQTDNTISLNTIVGDSTELEDLIEYAGGNNSQLEDRSLTPEQQAMAKSTIEVIREILKMVDEDAKDPKYQLLARFWFAIILKKPRNKHGKGSFLKAISDDFRAKQVMEYLEMVLHDKLMESLTDRGLGLQYE
jgi:hypothetical protein